MTEVIQMSSNKSATGEPSLIIDQFTVASPLSIAEGVSQLIAAYAATDVRYITTFPVQQINAFSMNGQPKIEILVLVALIGTIPKDITKFTEG